jgi:oligosaccharide repeat unit polymerase
MWSRILNPFLIFTLTWTFVLGLISLKLTTNINTLNPKGVVIIVVNIFTSILICIFFKLLQKGYKSRKNFQPSGDQLQITYKLANKCFYIFLILTIVDFIYSGGMPLLWLFTGSDKNYFNLGIPSIKGLQYTMYLFSFTLFAYILKFQKFNKWKIKLIVMILLPFVMLARGLMIYTIFQVFCVVMFDKKYTLKQFRNIVIFFLFLILIFGFIGDIRGPYANPFAFLINDSFDNPLLKLPSGFTWIYIYITANYNNILLTIGTFQPNNSFFNIVYNLIPGFFKQFITTETESPLITDASLNVASFYAGYVTSFGVIGAIIGGIILQLVSTYYYFKAKSANIGYILAYSIMFTCLILSVFFDAFLTVSTCAQILLAIYLANKIKSGKIQSIR